MTNLTWAKDGEWGLEGVDLAELPPKVYAAVFKLHQLEHDQMELLEQLGELRGEDEYDIQTRLDQKPGEWHPVSESPPLFINIDRDQLTSKRLLLLSDEGDIWPGYCVFEDKEQPHFYFLGAVGRSPTHWMEMPAPPEVFKMNTGEGEVTENVH